MFQLKLEFELENNVLPKNLDSLLVSFLKASIENYSKDLFESLYTKSKSVIKKYTFSYYLPGAKFSGENIILNQNRFTMFFSDCDLAELIHFFNAFKLMKSKKYPLSGNSMVLSGLFNQQRQKITNSEIIIKMQSSLLVRKHSSEDNTDIYFTYDNDEFCETVNQNVNIFLKKLDMQISTSNFSIIPVKGKKVVVPVFSRNTDGNLGVYKLTGSPELLNILYLAGIGVRRSEGHGKFEIIM